MLQSCVLVFFKSERVVAQTKRVYPERIFILPTFATNRRDLTVRALLESLECDSPERRSGLPVHSQALVEIPWIFYFMPCLPLEILYESREFAS